MQAMTTGEAEKLLSAKGYLKSRYQAMIGTRIPGRVEKMFVEEGVKVKKGAGPRRAGAQGHGRDRSLAAGDGPADRGRDRRGAGST